MGVDANAGSKFYFGPANSTAADQAAYEALSFQLVGEVENFGDFGDRVNEIRFTSVSDRRVRKIKGSYDAGVMSLTVGVDSADAGQQAILGALTSDSDFAIKVELADMEDGGSTNTIVYFRGKVMSAPLQMGNAENVIRRTFDIGINSPLVIVPRT